MTLRDIQRHEARAVSLQQLSFLCEKESVKCLLVVSKRTGNSGITPIGQGWTNARGLRGLGGPKPDPKNIVCIF